MNAAARVPRYAFAQVVTHVKKAIESLVALNPGFQFLYRGVEFLEGANFMGYWRDVHTSARSLRGSIRTAGVLAAVCPVVLCTAAWLVMYFGIRRNMVLMRKGKVDPALRTLVKHNTAEMYPANQLMHFLVGYVIQYFLFLLFWVVLLSPSILRWLWDLFGVVVIVTLVTILIRFIAVKVICAKPKHFACVHSVYPVTLYHHSIPIPRLVL